MAGSDAQFVDFIDFIATLPTANLHLQRQLCYGAGRSASVSALAPGIDNTVTTTYAALDGRRAGRHVFRCQNILSLAVSGAGPLGGNPLPLYDYGSFGGFLRMTGYEEGQLPNDSLTYGRLLYKRRIVELPLFGGVCVGGSLEPALLRAPLLPDSITGNIASAGLFLALDTPLGPAFVAYGRSLDGYSSAYFYLRRALSR